MLFDEQALDISVESFSRDSMLDISAESFSRDSIERTVPGLNGVLSVDLGLRGRKIRQTGTLRAKSRTQLDERISKITAFMDGAAGNLLIFAWIRSRPAWNTPTAPALQSITKSSTCNLFNR